MRTRHPGCERPSKRLVPPSLSCRGSDANDGNAFVGLIAYLQGIETTAADQLEYFEVNTLAVLPVSGYCVEAPIEFMYVGGRTVFSCEL